MTVGKGETALNFTAQDAARLTRQALEATPFSDAELICLLGLIKAQADKGEQKLSTPIHPHQRVVIVRALRERGFTAFAVTLSEKMNATLHVSWSDDPEGPPHLITSRC